MGVIVYGFFFWRLEINVVGCNADSVVSVNKKFSRKPLEMADKPMLILNPFLCCLRSLQTNNVR